MLEVRFGLIPDLGGTGHLARLVGQGRAKEIVWTGRTVEAEEADRVGLVNRVAPAAALDKEAEAYAREIASAPPLPVSMTKSLINRAHETSLETSLEREAQAQAGCIDSEDHREAVAAYIEKRPPRFTGR
jgi:enoyl-CoA hydratase/carnithine racemase